MPSNPLFVLSVLVVAFSVIGIGCWLNRDTPPDSLNGTVED